MSKLEILMNVLQLIGGIVLSIGYYPQIKRTLKTKSVGDISLAYYVNIFIGVFLMECYAFYNFITGKTAMFFVTNSIALACCTTMMILVAKYRDKNNK
ncbi:SemiSWEET family sugar transporter [Clostridium tagluense]|uniref:PQ loop repeat protein n=1 Tax=Clostridium tagluense TaxID=360422 RepID=A0A401UQC9_9CLOT|nr:PQ-loop domain-containing transporter [Clostridium tagluense]GCD11726.1 hypothetical protein Ctaglu_33490 [Clostridium tagluense]